MGNNIFKAYPELNDGLLAKGKTGPEHHRPNVLRTSTKKRQSLPKLFSIICLVGFIVCLGIIPSLPIEEKCETAIPNIRGAPTFSSAKHLLDEYQICHPSDWDSYVCKGETYDDFANKMEALILDQEYTHRQILSTPSLSLERKSPFWGKRRNSPFPANTTILALGNSHTRQVLQALPCQYPTLQFIDMESRKSDNVMRRGSYYFVEFANHAKLHLVTNNAIFYSKKWPQYLQELVQHDSLEDFDALIVGKMNGFAEAYNTSFMEVMMEKTAKLEDADFSTNEPPTVTDFAEQFQGPIVAHSMFCDWGGEYLYWDMYNMVQKLERPNVRLVNGRQYIPFLGECGSNKWQSVGVCEDDATAHRCIGERGGHPDLVAWDVVEALHDLLD